MLWNKGNVCTTMRVIKHMSVFNPRTAGGLSHFRTAGGIPAPQRTRKLRKIATSGERRSIGRGEFYKNIWSFFDQVKFEGTGDRGGSRIFPREGRLVQRGGIFRVGGRRGLTWAPYPYPISYLYTYQYVINRNINSVDLRWHLKRSPIIYI